MVFKLKSIEIGNLRRKNYNTSGHPRMDCLEIFYLLKMYRRQVSNEQNEQKSPRKSYLKKNLGKYKISRKFYLILHEKGLANYQSDFSKNIYQSAKGHS